MKYFKFIKDLSNNRIYIKSQHKLVQYKVNTMFTKFDLKQGTLEIQDLARTKCDSINDFADFVSNVTLQYSSPSDMGPFVDIIKRFPVQWVIPFRTLCMRYINQKNIINSVHNLFLTEAIKKNCLIEALPVINSEAFPFKMQATEQEYQYSCFTIYLKLGYYTKAYKKIESLVFKRNIYSKNPEKFVFSYLLMCRVFQQAYLNEESMRQSLKGASRFKDIASSQIISANQAILQNLICYAKRQQYQKEVMIFLLTKMDKYNVYHQLYELGSSQNGKLRGQVQSFKADKYQRIKLSDFKDQPLSNPKTMHQINLLSNMAKYDCKQRILYLNYQKCTQDEINDLISKCYQLSQAIKSAPSIKENAFGGRLRISGIGGIGGMGSLLGMMGGGHGFGPGRF